MAFEISLGSKFVPHPSTPHFFHISTIGPPFLSWLRLYKFCLHCLAADMHTPPLHRHPVAR